MKKAYILLLFIQLFAYGFVLSDKNFQNHPNKHFEKIKLYSSNISNVLISNDVDEELYKESVKCWPDANFFIYETGVNFYQWSISSFITSIDILILKECTLNKSWLKNLLNVVEDIQIIYINLEEIQNEKIEEYEKILEEHNFILKYVDKDLINPCLVFSMKPILTHSSENQYFLKQLDGKYYHPNKKIFFDPKEAPFSLDFNDLKPMVYDDEIQNIWEKINNIYDPSYEDYQLIEEYLKYGKRTYLDDLYFLPDYQRKLKKMFNLEITEVKNKILLREALAGRLLHKLKMVHIENELSQLQKIAINGGGERCILLYGTYNELPEFPKDYHLKAYNPNKESYADKVNGIINELKEVNWKGDVLFRIGGYPLIEKRRFTFCSYPLLF